MVFNAMAHRDQSKDMIVAHLQQRPDIIKTLLLGYDKPDLALSYGSMFRECIRPQQLAAIALHLPEFFNFFRYVQLENFEIAADAFSSFKELLTQHKTVVSEFLQQRYDDVCMYSFLYSSALDLPSFLLLILLFLLLKIMPHDVKVLKFLAIDFSPV